MATSALSEGGESDVVEVDMWEALDASNHALSPLTSLGIGESLITFPGPQDTIFLVIFAEPVISDDNIRLDAIGLLLTLVEKEVVEDVRIPSGAPSWIARKR